MSTHFVEAVWLNQSDFCSLDDLAELSGLSHAELHDLVEIGAIEPASVDSENYVFQTHYIVAARTARRLRDDFELDSQGLAVALSLLRRIRELELQLSAAYARLPESV